PILTTTAAPTPIAATTATVEMPARDTPQLRTLTTVTPARAIANAPTLDVAVAIKPRRQANIDCTRLHPDVRVKRQNEKGARATAATATPLSQAGRPDLRPRLASAGPTCPEIAQMPKIAAIG